MPAAAIIPACAVQRRTISPGAENAESSVSLPAALSAPPAFSMVKLSLRPDSINRLAFLDGLQNFDVLDGHRIDLERVLVEDDEVG